MAQVLGDPATHVQDLDGVTVSWLWSGLLLAVSTISRVNNSMGEYACPRSAALLNKSFFKGEKKKPSLRPPYYFTQNFLVLAQHQVQPGALKASMVCSAAHGALAACALKS